MLNNELLTREEWLELVGQFNSQFKKGSAEPGACMKVLMELGLLTVKERLRVYHGEIISGDAKYTLIQFIENSLVHIYVDPVKLGEKIKNLSLRKVQGNLYEHLCEEMWYSNKRAKSEYFERGYGSSVLAKPFYLSREDRAILNSIREWLGDNPCVDITKITDNDRKALLNELNIPESRVDYIKMYCDVELTTSLDLPINDGAGGGIPRQVVDLAEEIDERVDDGIYFLQELRQAYKAFMGKDNHCKPTLKCLITRFLTDKIVQSNVRFHVSDYIEARRKLKACSVIESDANAIGSRGQETKNNDGYPEISVIGGKLEACCRVNSMFDTLIACWLFALGSLALKENGSYNNELFARILSEAYAKADRKIKPPSSTSLGREPIMIHVHSVLETFLT